MRGLASRVGCVALLALGVSACASADGAGDPGSEEVGTSAAAVTAAEAIMRAEEWVSAKLLYCQSPNGANDTIDPACPPVCMRESDPAWDPYRSDCSGLVSWAWGLPAPGRTTSEFAPNQSDITSVIAASSLQMGDAVNTDDAISNEHHIMLFKAWTVPGQEATFIEEPGCAANPNYAHEFTSSVTLNGTSITVAYNGFTFKAIRYAALGSTSSSSSSSGAPPPSCQVDGVDGTCIDTSVCATMPGYVSTPGYCPGPASEQCCTPNDTASSSSGASTTSASSSSGAAGAGGASGAGGEPGAGGATVGGGSPTTSSGGHGHGASPPGNPGATSGCQTSAPASSPAGAVALLAGLLVLRRRRRALA